LVAVRNITLYESDAEERQHLPKTLGIYKKNEMPPYYLLPTYDVDEVPENHLVFEITRSGEALAFNHITAPVPHLSYPK